MFGHGGSSAGSYLADPISPIPSHCASIVVTSTLRVNRFRLMFTWTIFFVKVRLRAEVLSTDRGSNSWLPDHDSTFHVTEICSNQSAINDFYNLVICHLKKYDFVWTKVTSGICWHPSRSVPITRVHVIRQQISVMNSNLFLVSCKWKTPQPNGNHCAKATIHVHHAWNF